MRRLLFVMTITSCCIAIFAGKACASTNLVNQSAHTLTKEPAYRSGPKYCLITLDNNDAKIWMVEDGRRLFVDKNANGDLTDDGPPLEPAHVRNLDAARWDFEYLLDAITPADGPRSTKFVLRRWNYEGGEDCYGLSFSVGGRMPMYAGWFGTFWSTNRDEAPIVHFGGPLTPKMLRRKSFTIGEKQQRLSIGFFNPGSAPGAESRLSIDALPRYVIPVLKIEWPTASGAEPVRTSHELAERCCYWEYYTTTFEVPKGVVPGTAKVSVELPAGVMPARLTTKELEVPVAGPSTASNQKR